MVTQRPFSFFLFVFPYKVNHQYNINVICIIHDAFQQLRRLSMPRLRKKKLTCTFDKFPGFFVFYLFAAKENIL